MIKLFVVFISLVIFLTPVKSQEVTVNAGADIVSTYIWRGLYVGPASIQPGINFNGRFYPRRLGIFKLR